MTTQLLPAIATEHSVAPTDYYRSRFKYDHRRDGIWQAIIDHLLSRNILSKTDAVLELGAGYCHFINSVPATRKYALDVNPQLPEFAAPGIQTSVQRCDVTFPIASASLDVVFASNLFEHLTFAELDRTLAEVQRVLKPGARLVLIQPNYRYCSREYFDDYTHVTCFSHLSLPDYLESRGLTVKLVVPRYIPFSMKSRLPKVPQLVSWYLRLPIRPFAKQMLVVCETPARA